MDPNYCIDCATVHEGGRQTCPKKRDHFVRYTESKSWQCAGIGANDLKQSDLKPGAGYPEDLGHTIGRNPAKSVLVDDYQFGEPNCKIRMASLIFNVMKGGGSGGNHGSSPIDRETAKIRKSDEGRLISMYSFIKNPNLMTGIPTLDRERKQQRAEQPTV